MKTILTLTLLLLFFSCKEDSNNNLPPPTPKPNLPIIKTIVFWRPNPNGGIFTITTQGNDEKRLLPLPENSTVAHLNWGRDHRIYFTGTLQGEPNAQLYSIKEDGTDVKRISNDLDVEYSHLKVSVNNRLLYLKTATDGSSKTGLYYNSLGGTNEVKVFDLDRISLNDIDWASQNNGDFIVYIKANIKTNKNEEVTNIYIRNLEGTYNSTITANINEDKIYYQLSTLAGSETLLSIAKPDANSTGNGIYIIDLDSSLGVGEKLLIPPPAQPGSWLDCSLITYVSWWQPGTLNELLLLTDSRHYLHVYTTGGTSVKQLTQTASFDARVNHAY